MQSNQQQEGDTQKLLLRELKLMFSVLRPFAEIPQETWLGYTMGLENLTAPQILMIVPLVLKRRWEFPPQPIEIRDMIYEAEAQEPKAPEVPGEECKVCGGTGFKITERTDGLGGKWAMACDCRKRA